MPGYKSLNLLVIISLLLPPLFVSHPVPLQTAAEPSQRLHGPEITPSTVAQTFQSTIKGAQSFQTTVAPDLSNVNSALALRSEGVSPESAGLLQFTAGRHIIGFLPDQVYLVGLPHMLKVEFEDAVGVTPVVDPTSILTGEGDSSQPARQQMKADTSLTDGPTSYNPYPLIRYKSADQLTPRWLKHRSSPAEDQGELRPAHHAPRITSPIPENQPDNLQPASPLNRVTYPNLWPGVSLTYEAVTDGLAKSTYRLEPYAKVDQIRLRYNLPPELLPDGSLQFTPQWGPESGGGYITESPPIAWQEIAGRRIPVEVSFRLIQSPITNYQLPITNLQSSTVGFHLGPYDPAHPLLIDPTYRWHTFMGSVNGDDRGSAVVVDGSGNVYATGYSYTTWDGPGGTVPINPHSGGGYTDMVILKWSSSGTYQWHTFLGSSNGNDGGNAIAVDANGNIYVTGESDTTWNGAGGTKPLYPYVGDEDIVVLKLNSSGTYQWHTFMGGSRYDDGQGITVDGSSNVYVTGYSYGSWGGPGATPPLNPHTGSGDIVIMKLNSSGAYQWHTFMGGNFSDYGRGITIDSSGDLYVTGSSYFTWNGPGAAAPLNSFAGVAYNIVVLKLDNTGTYQWHTFMGGSSFDYGSAITVDGNGNVYVTGYSDTTWNGPGGSPPLNSFTGGLYDIIVLKLNSSGAYQWHTFIGNDQGNAIAIDSNGNVYVTGYSDTTWNGPGGTAPLTPHAGKDDIVVLKLNSSGTYQWHTFIGADGGDYDYGYGIAVDESGNVYVTGSSEVTWDGPGGKAPLNPHAGKGDLVVLKLSGNGSYQWHTFMGSDSKDYSSAIAVDGTVNVYITGQSDTTWNGPGETVPSNLFAGPYDMVILQWDDAPDLKVSKTNNTGGTILADSVFTWRVVVTNTGHGAATFADTTVIFQDNLPDEGGTYGPPTIQNIANTVNGSAINCTLARTDLICTANGNDVILGAAGGKFEITFPVTPTAGVLANPRDSGLCRVDPDAIIIESDEANNDCNDTVTILAPDLRLTKAVSSKSVVPGQTLTYTLVFSNVGTAVASRVVITDILPVSVLTLQNVISSGVTMDRFSYQNMEGKRSAPL